jgi:hypothetical protein
MRSASAHSRKVRRLRAFFSHDFSIDRMARKLGPSCPVYWMASPMEALKPVRAAKRLGLDGVSSRAAGSKGKGKGKGKDEDEGKAGEVRADVQAPVFGCGSLSFVGRYDAAGWQVPSIRTVGTDGDRSDQVRQTPRSRRHFTSVVIFAIRAQYGDTLVQSHHTTVKWGEVVAIFSVLKVEVQRSMSKLPLRDTNADARVLSSRFSGIDT